eukprot:763103-Hanusia_phi.AAC.1
MSLPRRRIVAAAAGGLTVVAGLLLVLPSWRTSIELMGLNGLSESGIMASGSHFQEMSYAGTSSEDQSPEIPRSFMQEESRSKRRMLNGFRLKKALKRSLAMSENLDREEKSLKEYMSSTVSAVKNDIVELNSKETDEINAEYHVIPGLP